MTSTTIRVDKETHRRLLAISRATNRPLIEILRDAADELERARFATLVTSQLETLRHETRDWERYIADADLAAHDGIS